MNNKNSPITPTVLIEKYRNSYRTATPREMEETFNPLFAPTGLSKREYAAIMAMQGLLAGYGGRNKDPKTNDIVEYSVKYADALFTELDKTQEEE